MTDSDRESRSIETWKKVREHLEAEVPDVGVHQTAGAHDFFERSGSVVRLVASPSYRAWIANTFGPRMLALWNEETREEDDKITELEIIAQERSGPKRKPEGQDQRRAQGGQDEAELDRGDKKRR